MSVPRPRPWEVWWVDFDPQVGREQSGRRPAIVVGSDLACRLPNGLAIVVPTTTRSRGLPYQPLVMLGDTASYAMTEQIKAISLERFSSRHRVGRLAPEQIEPVHFALHRMLV